MCCKKGITLSYLNFLPPTSMIFSFFLISVFLEGSFVFFFGGILLQNKQNLHNLCFRAVKSYGGYWLPHLEHYSSAFCFRDR